MAVFLILCSIIAFMFLAYRGISVLLLSPLLAFLLAVLSPDMHALASYTQIFMPGMGNFIIDYFPLFFVSAIFGKLMDVSGSAAAISRCVMNMFSAKHAIVAIVFACGVLTHGGVSLFVVVFTVYPIAAEIFRSAGIPKRLMPATIALGSFTFTMSALPGAPAIQNIIPSRYFGTDSFAAAGLGCFAALLIVGAGLAWLYYRAQNIKDEFDPDEYVSKHDGTVDIPSSFVAFLPLILVLVLNYAMLHIVFPKIDTSYLLSEKYGGITLDKISSIWSVLISLSLASVLCLLMNFKKLNVLAALTSGANDAIMPIFNTSSVLGYGAVVSALSGFAVIKNWIVSISSSSEVATYAFVTSALSGITGSASGGMTIALNALSDRIAALQSDPAVLHRIVALASGCLDTLPHNGAVVTLLAICGMTHKKSYKDICVVSLVLPLCVTSMIVLFGYN